MIYAFCMLSVFEATLSKLLLGLLAVSRMCIMALSATGDAGLEAAIHQDQA